MNERSQRGEDSRRRLALRPMADSVRRGALSQDRPARRTASLASLWSSERAVAAVELALILPVFMIMLLGTIDLGRFGFAAITVSNAARTAASYCLYDPTCTILDAQLKTLVKDEASPYLNLDDALPEVVINVSRPDTPDPPCPCLEVQVRYQFQALVPWPGLPSDFWIGRSARMPRGIE